MPIRYFKPVAVIDEVTQSDSVSIWHVDVAHPADFGAPMPRLSGAWCFPVDELNWERVRSLLANRFLVLSSATDLIDRLEVPHAGVVDITRTVDAVRAEITKLQDAFADHAAQSRSKLTAPDWPTVPHPTEIAASFGPGNDEKTGAALALARGFERLAFAWEQVEKQRVQRSFLKEFGGPDPRPLPLVTINTPA
ncbi:hypothetical protein GS966_15340 [Rhodococcus hoagii]|nr:hypothetical protein [Prescottella equi]NKS73867.1 hypothetical protein [Prescottella equi]NKZ91299.1 hypothetical protein [Prescottella equi]